MVLNDCWLGTNFYDVASLVSEVCHGIRMRVNRNDDSHVFWECPLRQDIIAENVLITLTLAATWKH